MRTRSLRYRACEGKLFAMDDKFRGNGHKMPRSDSGLRQARGRDGNDQSKPAADPSTCLAQQ
jgi:hypothetical protein